MQTRLYTIGYSGHSPESFVARLRKAGVELLLDIRQNPISRKKGFSKRQLAENLKHAGVEYAHAQELGVPRELRDRLKTHGDREGYMHDFLEYLGRNQEILERVLKEVNQKRCCLMCMEADPLECHRSVVAEELRGLAAGKLVVEHLQGEMPPL